MFSISPVVGNQPSIGNFTNLNAGSYTITATDIKGCTQTVVIIINQNPAIEIVQLTNTEPTCHGNANATLTAVASGGISPLTYQLDISNPKTDGYFTNLYAGSHVLTIRDALNCMYDTTIYITEPAPITLDELTVNPVYCIGSNNGKIIAKAKGGNGDYTYNLTPGLRINKSGFFINLYEGIYTLSVRDKNNCTYDTAVIVGPPINPFKISINKKNLNCYGMGNEGWAEAIPQGGEAPYTYLWSTTPIQTTARAENLQFGYYFVEVTDAGGCVAKDTVYIEPGPCCEEVFIPNAFSPNGDGNNDVFKVITSSGIELIQFDVYNRWGNRVWSTNDFRSGWDGTFDGQPEGMNTFFWIFKYRCLTDGQIYTKKGDVILVR
jgi:hypothetical protein